MKSTQYWRACYALQSVEQASSSRYTPTELIVSLIAILKAGASLYEACAQLSHRPHTQVTIDDYLMRRLVHTTVHPSSFRQYVTEDAFVHQLCAVCKLSEMAGCSTAQCLEILHEDIRRHEQRSQRRTDATAVARMTIRVLLALPLFTFLVSSLSGVGSFVFMTSSPLGWGCIALSVTLYAAGLAWMKALLKRFEKATQPSLMPQFMTLQRRRR